MKTVSAALLAHMQEDCTTICTCWKATLRDGTVYGFTNHDEDIVLDGVTYEAAAGYTPSAISTTCKLNVDNLEVEGMLSSPSITAADLFSGKWDSAEIEVFNVNYADLTQGTLYQRRGWLGEVTVKNGTFVAEHRGLAQKLQQPIGELFSPGCRATLGDTRCGVVLAGYTTSGAVESVTSNRQFADTANLTANAAYYDYGLVTWTSGLNDGLSMEVKTYTVGNVTLQLNMPFDIAVGDTFDIIAGCDGKFSTCKNKFNNVKNFRGEPHVPGIDHVTKGPN